MYCLKSTGYEHFRIQLPIRLAYAMATHTRQGQTLDRVVINIGDEGDDATTGGRAEFYVAAEKLFGGANYNISIGIVRSLAVVVDCLLLSRVQPKLRHRKKDYQYPLYRL